MRIIIAIPLILIAGCASKSEWYDSCPVYEYAWSSDRTENIYGISGLVFLEEETEGVLLRQVPEIPKNVLEGYSAPTAGEVCWYYSEDDELHGRHATYYNQEFKRVDGRWLYVQTRFIIGH